LNGDKEYVDPDADAAAAAGAAAAAAAAGAVELTVHGVSMRLERYGHVAKGSRGEGTGTKGDAGASSRDGGGAPNAADEAEGSEWQMVLHVRHIDVRDRTRKRSPGQQDRLADERRDERQCDLLHLDTDAPPQVGLQGYVLAASARMLGSEQRASFQLQPLRLTLHQSTLAFLHRFFASAAAEDSPPRPPRRAPSATFGSTGTSALTSESLPSHATRAHSHGRSPAAPAARRHPTFFAHVDIHQIDLRFDYVPTDASSAYYRRVLHSTAAGDVSSAAAEMAQLVPLQDVTFSFTRVRVAGASSWADVLTEVAAKWWPQLLRQLHRVLSGMPVVRSLVHLSDGLSALLLAPLRPAPLRALQHGGAAFGRAVATEGLSLTANAFGYAQALLEQIHVLLSSVPVGALTK
jgi:hypothetical protein